jgi:cytochrome c oxidase subunit 4
VAEHQVHSDTHHADEGVYHSHIGRYVAALAALLFFSGLTYACHIWIDGPAALPVALMIAVTKALIVILFFMHLIDHPGPNRLVMGVTILLLMFGMAMVYADSVTRFPLANPHF